MTREKEFMRGQPDKDRKCELQDGESQASIQQIGASNVEELDIAFFGNTLSPMNDGSLPPAVSVDALRFGWPGQRVPTLAIGKLRLAAGASLFLYGPSGCGKSTLLAAIAGVLDIDRGQIAVAGTDVAALRGGRRDRFRADHLGIIFQVFNLVPWMSAIDNVLLPLRFSDRRRCAATPDPQTAARRLLAELGLSDPNLIRAPARALSVGQQQRVAAARALIGAPEVILADEPTSALDDDAKARFVDLLIAECRAAGSALLFVSHDHSLETHFDAAVDFQALNGGLAG